MFSTIWKHTSTPRLWFTTGLIAAMLGVAIGTALRGEATRVDALGLALMHLTLAGLSLSLLYREAQVEEAKVRRTIDITVIRASEHFCLQKHLAAEDPADRDYWRGATVSCRAVAEQLAGEP